MVTHIRREDWKSEQSCRLTIKLSGIPDPRIRDQILPRILARHTSISTMLVTLFSFHRSRLFFRRPQLLYLRGVQQMLPLHTRRVLHAAWSRAWTTRDVRFPETLLSMLIISSTVKVYVFDYILQHASFDDTSMSLLHRYA